MPSPLVIERGDRVAVLTISRPEKLNALNSALLKELDGLLDTLACDEEIRALVITGAGPKAFVAGADIAELAALGPTEARRHAALGQAVLTKIENLGKPVIAAINGFALGGGLELAMACHVRVAANQASMGLPEVTLGVIPGFGGTQRLARLVGPGKAYEMVLSGDRITAEEALRIGLVQSVVPGESLLEEAKKLASKMARNAPLALRFAMDAIQRGLGSTLVDGLALEADLFGLVAATQDMKEGTKAFLEKRKAEFRGA